MTVLWVDGDACPKLVREIVFRAAIRCKIDCFLVSNTPISLPPNPLIHNRIVEQGFDKADDAIEEAVCKGDIVITSDLPLAEACLKKAAEVLSVRGERFSLNSIQQKLALRDFHETLRSSGLHTGGPKSLSSRDVQQFANQLDRLLSKACGN